MKATAFSLAAVLLSSPAFAFNAHQPFDISADMLEYSDTDQALIGEGHVVVTQGTSTLKADSMRYERQAKRLSARGHVFLSEKGSVLLGETLDYDLVKETGQITNALGYASPWIFSGTSWEKHLDYFVGRDASFTSCDLADPHYHLHARSVHMVPDNYFWAWNNIAYADNVPVFYTPFVYRNLAKRRVVIHFQPGHDGVNGDFVKTMTTIRYTDEVYSKVYYDYYSQQGSGIGSELNYAHAGKLQGSLFGYYIDPRGNPIEAGAPQAPQYNLRSYHWQRLDQGLSLQSNINLRRNVSFNNQYFQQDPNLSVNDLISSIAITRQKGHINQRLVVEALQAPDSTDPALYPVTHIQNASLPRYDFTLYQMPVWSPTVSSGSVVSGPKIGPLMFNANATLGETYYRLDKDMHASGDGSFTLSQGYPITRQWSFTPTVTPSLHWQDKFNPQPPPPAGSTTPVSTVGLFRGYQGRVGTAETLRWRPFSAITLDNIYSLTARMEPNGLGLDRRPADGGIETQHLSWVVFWRPTRRVMLRSLSGYDFRDITDESPESYHQRKWDAWTTELTNQINRRSDTFFRYALESYPVRGELWEGDYRFYGPYKTRYQTGLLYNRGAPGVLTWNNSLGIYLSPGWRVDATLHSLLPKALQKSTLIDDEYIVTRDLHCWQAQFIYRNIPPLARSYSLMFNLKLGVKAEKEITNEELESTYYPWRANMYAN